MPDWADFGPELLCLGVDLVISGILCKCYENANKVVRELSAAPELNIDSNLKNVIRNHPDAVCDKVTDTVTLPYAALRGSVAPLGKSVVSIYPQRSVEGVIQKVVFTQYSKSRQHLGGLWLDRQRVLHQLSSHVPFCLADTEQGGLFSPTKAFVEVLDWKVAARVDMVTVHDEFESNSASIGEHLWNHFVAGEVPSGVRKTESMLTTGATLTGVGRVVLGPMGFKLLPPEDGKSFFLIDSLKSLIKEETSRCSFYKYLVYTFSSLGLFFTGYIAWKYFKLSQREKEARRNHDTLAEIVRDRETRNLNVDWEGDGTRELPDRLVCVVCLGAEREVIVLPCGHVCVCATCADTLLHGGHACPVCRGPILTVMPAYLS